MNVWAPLSLSLIVATCSSLLVLLPALLGYGLQRGLLGWGWRWLLSLPLALPPLVSGVALLWFFSPLWPLGAWLTAHGWNPVLTLVGAVLAAALVSLPLAVAAGEDAWAQVPAELLSEARGLGACRREAIRGVALPLLLPGVSRCWLISFQRALGEFGATLLVAGNSPGRTQTLPLALYSAAESGQHALALQLLGWSVGLSLLCVGAAAWLSRRAWRRMGRIGGGSL